ncbi:MAG: tRNA (adenosine(37)-N6)-dimethylallyltransferase MiaA [Christensenellales bacterium]
MDNANKIKIGLIVGPTASGKTAASIALAKKLDAEIVSADSIQVYRGMDIGSAKPTMEERQGIPHHLMDAVDIDSPRFSVAEYRRMAGEAIEDIINRGKYPLIVGGTGLYVNSLIYPLNFTTVASDEKLRAKLAALEQAQKGAVYALLKKEDPKAAERLHPNDTKRIIRALEVVRLTGKPIDDHGGDFANSANAEIPYQPTIIGLTMPREALYERINLRVDIMLEQGLLDEAKAIYDAGYDASLPALQGLGYKQLFKYFGGEYTLEQTIDAIKLETRRFAKRQLTWFRRDKRIIWFDISDYPDKDALNDAIYRIFAGGER